MIYEKKDLFRWFNLLISVVSFGMSVINIITDEYVLLVATALFSLLTFINFLYHGNRTKTALYGVFGIEGIALLAFFLISGIPDGFSILWSLLIPSFSMLLFGIIMGSYYSAVVFLMIAFFFWIPFGQELLQYDYSTTFMLRFPFLYLAIYFISLFVEYVRSTTYSKLKILQQQNEYMCHHDALTGLYNRYGFQKRFVSCLSAEHTQPLSVIMIDIDYFKCVNDKYGHDAGDVVLKSVADIIAATICKDAMCSRWGGEEFNIATTCTHNPYETAERIRKAVEETTFSVGDKMIHVTVSVGVCIAKQAAANELETVIKIADDCLYESKKAGRNRTSQRNFERKLQG